jgi:hypothetical protein
VETAGLAGKTAKEVRKMVDDLGLVVSSAHIGLPTKENLGEIVDTAKTLGNEYVISGLGGDHFSCNLVPRPRRKGSCFRICRPAYGQIEPEVGLDIVLRHAVAVVVHQTEAGLCAGDSLFGGQAQPLHFRCVVLRHALAVFVHQAEVRLGRCISLLGSQAVPLHRLCVVQQHADAVAVYPTEAELGDGPCPRIE